VNITEHSRILSTLLTSYSSLPVTLSSWPPPHLSSIVTVCYLLPFCSLTVPSDNLCLTLQDGGYAASVPNTKWEYRKSENFT